MPSLSLVFMLTLLGSFLACAPNPEGAVNIHAKQNWYLERPEPEQSFQGELERFIPLNGPNSRLDLKFALVGDQKLLVYSAGVEAQLEPFVGQTVRITGKRVDLQNQGFDVELWIAEIERLK